MKTCKICGKNKPLKQFYRAARNKDGHQGSCKLCNRDRAKKVRNALTNDERRRRYIWKRFKITPEQFQKLWDGQKGRCRACDTAFSGIGTRYTDAQIDHDHKCCATSRSTCGACVGGLLCGRCNKIQCMVNYEVSVQQGVKE